MSIHVPQRRRPRGHRRAAWLTGAAAAAVLIAAGGALLLPRPRPPSGPAPGQPPQPPRSDSRVPPRAAGGKALRVSTAGWRAFTVDGAPVPRSPSAGPSRARAGLASGYARSRAGAVIAAVNTAVRVSGQLGPDIFTPTIRKQVTGPASGDLLDVAWQEYGQSGSQAQPAGAGGPAGTATAAVLAFRLTAWTPQSAAVTVASQAMEGAPGEVTVTLQVRWLSGDWRLVAPAGGNFPVSRSRPGVPAGFTPLPKAVTS